MTASSDLRYDVTIVGGGLVGGSLALALTAIGLKVALVERVPLRDVGKASYDDRTLALSLASRRIFEGISLWPGLDDGVTPIRKVHVSNRGHFGTVTFEASEYGLEALGYVAEGRVIGGAVAAELPRRDGLDLYIPAEVKALDTTRGGATVALATDDGSLVLRSALVVGADGTHSTIRALMGLPAETHDYGHTAVIANVTPRHDHAGVAYERMTTSGPLAVLPHVNGRCGIVWCTPSSQAQDVLDLSDADFLQGLQQRFGYRLGRFQKAGARASYPISRLYAARQVGERSLIIGNAAHTIYPVAAQGFNLGLRDVALLTELVADAAGGDIGSPDLLERYQQLRARDHQRMVQFTDGMIRVFAPDLLGFNALRSAGLVALQTLPFLKNALARRTLGLGGHVPRLALGENLGQISGDDSKDSGHG
ncbi:MAG: 2-octaprenyl-6-methoxyphenyl hydroxylase [Xanthomonadales bacterium]|nr:2-octaprenyl-6-methoxyphenyl hydroxylase [Xanthomonadales bacterium]